MKNYLPVFLLLSINFAFSEASFGQVYKVINYECLETPLVLLSANHDNTVTYCTNGLTQVETLDEDCYEFYEEDQNIFRGWFFNDLDSEGNVLFDFNSIVFHDDAEWTGTVNKYFEMNRAGFWLTLPSVETPQSQFSLAIKDLSEGGINIGFSMEDGPMYFPTLEEVLNTEFPGLSLEYTDEVLTVRGSVRNFYIGGDHLYLGHLELSEMLTSVETIEGIDVQLFPNPVTDMITIKGEMLTDAMIKVCTPSGRQYTVQSSQGEQMQVDVSGLPNGVFWLQIWKDQQLIHTEAITKF